MRRSNGESGFTLVEVLVALVVTVSAVAILAQGFAAAGSASVASRYRTRAVWLAAQKMADMEAGVYATNAPQAGVFETADDANTPAGQWRWEIASEAAATTGLYQITVSVFWIERSEERSYHLVRLMRERTEASQ
jgi:prepilin-type N-terminal cleavage/methylation domain-containing protein